LVELLEVS